MEVNMRFTGPEIPKLRGEKNLDAWKLILCRTLASYGWLEYITTDVPEPDDATEKRQWILSRNNVNLLLSASLTEHETYQTMINNGWDPDEPDPKRTYDKVLVAIPRIAEDTVGVLMEEYAGIRRRNFDSLQKFLDRLQYLKNRLKSIDVDMGPKAHLWIALIAVKDDYKENYLLWCRDMKNNALTWNLLMEEFSAIAAREKVDINMVSIETATLGTRITQTRSSNPSGGKSDNLMKMHCNKCNRNVNENHSHCDTCQRCRPGSVCWVCEPEKAPDSWPGKNEALQQKQDQHSTTAPLPQNSGLGTPSTTATPRPNRDQGSFLFGSNFMVIDLGMDKPNVEDLSLGAHSEPSVEAKQTSKEKPITGDTLVWDSGGSITKFNHLKWHTEIHPLARPMAFSSENEDEKPSQALYCLNPPVNLISSEAMKQDGVGHHGTNDKLVVKEANREPVRVYWNNNVAIVPSYPPPSLDIEYVDKTIITVRGQKEPLQKLQQDVPDSTANKNQKDKAVTKASRLLTPEPTPEPDERPATKPPKSTGLQGVDDEMPDKNDEPEQRTSQRKRTLRFGQKGKKGLYRKLNNRQLDRQIQQPGSYLHGLEQSHNKGKLVW